MGRDQAGADLEPDRGGRGDGRRLAGREGARAGEGHVAAEDVQQDGQPAAGHRAGERELVERRPEPPDAGLAVEEAPGPETSGGRPREEERREEGEPCQGEKEVERPDRDLPGQPRQRADAPDEARPHTVGPLSEGAGDLEATRHGPVIVARLTGGLAVARLAGSMTLSKTAHGPVEVLSFPDSLSAVTAADVRQELKELIQSGRSRLVMDMAKVRFVDSSGLSVFVVALKAARAQGGDVVLLKLTPEVRSIIELTRLHRVFEIFDDLDAAIAKLKRV